MARVPHDERPVRRRSHAAIPVAFALLAIGAILGRVTVLVPLLLGLLLLSAGGSFLATRVNPLSTGFYLTTKPSWSSVGVVFLTALVLFVVAYEYFVRGLGPVVP